MPENISHLRRHTRKRSRLLLSLGGICSLMLLLIACSNSVGESASTTNSDVAIPKANSGGASTISKAAVSNASSQSNSGSGGGQQDPGPQYLIKSLKVTLSVKNTRQVANDLQTWITQTDPLATSTGADYEDQGNQQYTVTLSFSVEASLYPKVYNYLKNYDSHGDELQSFNETTQDVTNDYIDTNSRITNDKAEQKRLQTLMSQATDLSDVLTIEQQLTTVEGDIETYEAHQNLLTSQVTFYTVSITINPTYTAPPIQSAAPWSIGEVFQGAFAASISVGEGLLTMLIWLLFFCLYLVPVALIVWILRRWGPRWKLLLRPEVALATSVPKAATTNDDKEEEKD